MAGKVECCCNKRQQAGTYQRFSLRVKDGYFVEIVVDETGDVRLGSGAIYFGNIDSMKMSGRTIMKERPFGSHEITSDETSLSFNIASKRWGNVSLFASVCDVLFALNARVSSLT